MLAGDLVAFPEDLSDRNNKQQLDANRKRHKQLRARSIELTADILELTVPADPDPAGVDRTKSVFRINRDIRFPADKSQYKTTFSAVPTPSKRGRPDRLDLENTPTTQIPSGLTPG